MDNALQSANQNTFDYQSAKDQGFSDADLQDYISRHPNLTVINKPGDQTTQPQPAQPQSSGGGGLLSTIADYLPTIGGVAGGLLGSELGPGALATAGVGSAAGEGLKELIKGKPLSGGDIATQGVLGAAGEGVGGLIGKVGGAVVGKVGGKMADLGEETAARGFFPSKTQQANFLEGTGEKMGSFLQKRGLAGADAEAINAHVSGAQDAFDQIAKSPDLTVKPDDVVSGFADEIQNLRQSILPADHAKADALQNIGLHFISKYGDKDAVSAAEMTALRRKIDTNISENTFDSAVANPMKSTRNILQTSIQQAADNAGLTAGGKSLKDAGQELNKLYQLRDITNKQQFLGKGTKPLGLGDIPGFLFGEAGAPVLGLNGPAGAAAGIALQHVLNSPRALGLASKLLSKGGESLANGALPPMVGAIASRTAGQGVSHLISPTGAANQSGNNGNNNTNALNGSEQANQQNNPEPNHGGTISQGINGVNTDENGNVTLPALDSVNNPVPMAYSMQDAMNDQAKAGSNPILLDAIAQRYNMSKAAAESYISAHQLEPGEKEFMQHAEQTNQMMNELRGLIKKVGTGPQNSIPYAGYIRSQTDPDYARMVALMQQLRGQSVKAIEGGRPSNFDLQALNAMPSEGETTASALAKLEQAQQILAQQYTRQLPAYALTAGQMPDMTAPTYSQPNYTMPDMTAGQ